MKLKSIIIILNFCVVSTLAAQTNPSGKVKSLQSGQELHLSGMAVGLNLQQDFYIAALYQGKPSRTVSAAMATDNPKRMEMRIATDSLSPRKFRRYWGQLINMNNTRAVIHSEKDSIKKFLSAFKDRMYFGDSVVFEYEPELGTTVAHNGKILAQISGEGIYQVLLNTWLGPKPPSQKFKAGLLGRNSDNEAISLMSAFVSTTRETGQALTQQND